MCCANSDISYFNEFTVSDKKQESWAEGAGVTNIIRVSAVLEGTWGGEHST
jgi:hypothetical protein